MNYAHHSEAYQVPATPPVEQSDWAGYLALFLVTALIIIAIIFYLYNRNRGTTSAVWTFVQGGNPGGNATFVGENYNIYVVNTTAATLALTVTPPTAAVGKTFAIDNTKTSSSTTVNISGDALGTVAPGKFAQFVWNSQASAVRMY